MYWELLYVSGLDTFLTQVVEISAEEILGSLMSDRAGYDLNSAWSKLIAKWGLVLVGAVQSIWNRRIFIIVLLLLLLLSLLVFYFHQTVNVRFAPNGKQKKQKKKKSWFMCKPDPKVFSKNKVQYDSPLIWTRHGYSYFAVLQVF